MHLYAGSPLHSECIHMIIISYQHMHVNIECVESFSYLWNKSEVGNGLKSQIIEVQRLYYFIFFNMRQKFTL